MARSPKFVLSHCTRGPRKGSWMLHDGNCREAGWEASGWGQFEINVVHLDTAWRHAERLARMIGAHPRLPCPIDCLAAHATD